MWHYEYVVDDVPTRVRVSTLEEAMTGLDAIRAQHADDNLTGIRIYQDGTDEFGTGQLHYAAPAPDWQ